MKERNWQNVAVLYEETKLVFLTAYNQFLQELPRVYPQGKIALSAPISNFGIPLSSIINQHLRVVIVLSGSDVAHKMLCTLPPTDISSLPVCVCRTPLLIFSLSS